jgi:hypothetical protein
MVFRLRPLFMVDRRQNRAILMARPDSAKSGFEEIAMETYPISYVEQIDREIRQTPDEYLPILLGLVRLFRQGITLKTAEDSFKQGWQETMRGETLPISDLWVGIDAK